MDNEDVIKQNRVSWDKRVIFHKLSGNKNFEVIALPLYIIV